MSELRYKNPKKFAEIGDLDFKVNYGPGFVKMT